MIRCVREVGYSLDALKLAKKLVILGRIYTLGLLSENEKQPFVHWLIFQNSGTIIHWKMKALQKRIKY